MSHPAPPPNLHGERPAQAATVLLLIDVINDFAFPEAELLLRHARPMAKRIAELKRGAQTAGIPVIYVNDNFGRWRSDFRATVEHCSRPDSLGREIVTLLHPGPDDYFVLKPKHSAFYCTTLDILLRDLQTRRVILAGVAGDICVLFTANDAYMRGLELVVPADCIASETTEKTAMALEQMRTLLRADVRPATEIPWERFSDAKPQPDWPDG